ncbi:transposase [Hymenobacter metallilatus]|uniref:Transposase IS200-like domain-containing protein n=1 Tax=Hymenobacter metallilatus TaxID=2493666 RepID=A0A428IXN9_9BACT|nr:hypothetical protein EI290_21945 [Hymenobacter metallilatus]
MAKQDVSGHSFCVMSNHVHAVVQLPLELSDSLASLMQQLKGAPAREANQLLQRCGAFWQHESLRPYTA